MCRERNVVALKGAFFSLAEGNSLQSNKTAMSFEEGFLTTKKPVLDFDATPFSTVPFPPTVCYDTMELNSRAAEITVKGEGN